MINFIETHYSRPISIKELEGISYYSYRNLQRIFKYTCGETIGAFQKRIRVERGYKLALYTNESMTEIALEVGFENLASFSKAFKQHFGVSPKEARANKAFLFERHAILPIASKAELKPEIVYMPPMKVYYRSTQTEYVNEEIEALWSEFMGFDFPALGTEYFGVVADEPLITDTIRCRYDACASMQARGKRLPSKLLFGGRYAKFIHRGSYDSIDETYQKIYGGWILTTDLEFSPLPIVEHYVKHDSNTELELDYLTGILIPIQR